MVDVSNLDSIISKIRRVKYGDYVLSDDHNNLLDAIISIRDILSSISVGAPTAAPSYPPSPLSPSGLDPNDPAWTPPSGWNQVFNFDSVTELQSFANNNLANADIENSVIYPTAPNGFDVERLGQNATSGVGIANYAFAVCFAVPWLHMASGYRPIVVISSNYGEIDILAKADSQVKLFVYDTTDSSWSSFWNTYQWLVLLVDFGNNICKVFDHNKNIIFQKTMSVSPGGSNDVFWIQFLQEEWFTADNAISKHWWVFIDWYCEYYAVEQTFPTGPPLV